MLTSNNQGEHKFGNKIKPYRKIKYYTNYFHVSLSATIFDSHIITKFVFQFVLNSFI